MCFVEDTFCLQRDPEVGESGGEDGGGRAATQSAVVAAVEQRGGVSPHPPLQHCTTLSRGGERPLLCHCVVVLQQVGDDQFKLEVGEGEHLEGETCHGGDTILVQFYCSVLFIRTPGSQGRPLQLKGNLSRKQ